MANEIKFIFSGDTAAFDKAIDSVVKKTNKAKASTEKITEAQKAQVKLQKLLNEEYSRGAKTTGGILKIQKDIKSTERERVKLSKRLNDASLTRVKRLRTIVELSKSEARLAGLTAARRSKVLGVAGRAGGSTLARLGLGAAASAGGAAVGAAGASALLGPVGIAIAALVLAVGAAVVALKILKGIVSGTAAAMKLGMSTQKSAQMAGKTVAQVQAEGLSGTFGGDPDDVRLVQLFTDLGMIIDKELIKSLADSGKKIRAVTLIIGNLLIPVFKKLAKVTADAIVYIGGTVKGHMLAMGPVIAYLKAAPFNPAGAIMQYDFDTVAVAQAQFKQEMEQLLRLGFAGPAGVGVGGGAGAGNNISDSLARIGIFKGQADSQLQTLKANLAAVQSIQGNTSGLIPAITNA